MPLIFWSCLSISGIRWAGPGRADEATDRARAGNSAQCPSGNILSNSENSELMIAARLEPSIVLFWGFRAF